LKKLFRVLLLPALLLTLPSITGAPKARATVVPKKILFFQGNMTAWKNAVGAQAIADRMNAADIVVVSHAGTHNYGGSEWPNNAYGARGCTEVDDRATLLDVLNRVRINDATVKGTRTLIFGYVAGTADAPDETGRQALCGNNVNNLETPYYGTNTATDFTACPGPYCQNTVYWVDEWTDGRDSMNWYIDGIFYDYVNSTKMSPTVRDNIYSYVKTKTNPITFATLRIMANSTKPGWPCGHTTACVAYGEQENFTFAANSNYMTANDYVLVEGYYAAGFTGHCTSGTTTTYLWYPNWCASRTGTATTYSTDTNAIAGSRNTVANLHGGVRVKLAGLVTEPPDAGFNSVSCTWSDFTSARTIFDASSITGDAITFQISDLGTIDDPANGVPDRDVSVCP
jgi:hypothetical protein